MGKKASALCDNRDAREVLHPEKPRGDDRHPPGGPQWGQSLPVISLSCHQLSTTSRRKIHILLGRGVSFKALRRATEQCRQGQHRSMLQQIPAVLLKTGIWCIGIKSLQIAAFLHSCLAGKELEVKTRRYLKVKVLSRKVVKQRPAFLQSIAQAYKDCIKLRVRNLGFTLDLLLILKGDWCYSQHQYHFISVSS